MLVKKHAPWPGERFELTIITLPSLKYQELRHYNCNYHITNWGITVATLVYCSVDYPETHGLMSNFAVKIYKVVRTGVAWLKSKYPNWTKTTKETEFVSKYMDDEHIPYNIVTIDIYILFSYNWNARRRAWTSDLVVNSHTL